jgi:ABC-2 type transport system permease protein
MNKKFKITNSVKYGTYSLISIAILLAVIIILNLALGILPAKYTSITDNKEGIYDISDTSKRLLSSLEEDITIYVIATQDQASDYHLMIVEYLKRYSELSSNITVKQVDPVLRPTFVSNYTDVTLDAGYTHIIVVNNKTDRADVYQFSDIIASVKDPSLTDEEQYYYYMSYGTYKYIYTFNLESCLISGITYVSMTSVPCLYYTTGHGETSVDAMFTQIMELGHVTLNKIDLTLDGEIPSEAEMLLIYGPTNDFSETEIKYLEKYVSGGGNIVLVSGYNSKATDRNLPNLYSFMEKEYGLSFVDAMVFEGNTDYAYKYGSNYLKYQFYPQASGNIANAIGKARIILTNAHPIVIAETLPDGVKASAILTTTDKGYSKAEVLSTEKGENDPEGKFNVGVQAEKTVSGVTSKCMWFSSLYALNIDGTYTSYYQYANIYITVHIMSEMVTEFNPESVEAVSLAITQLNISEKAGKVWGLILIGVIPAAILGYGFYNRYRRARR